MNVILLVTLVGLISIMIYVTELIPEVGKDIVEKSSRTVTIFLYFGTIVILICIVQAIKLFTETKNEGRFL